MPRIRKALILAAGYGTRFLPATKAVPKEMLPIVDRPVIQYIVEEALASGLDQLYIVTSTAKRAVEDHFDRLAELELALADKPEMLAEVGTARSDAFIRQKEMHGQAHAILATRPFIGDEPFALSTRQSFREARRCANAGCERTTADACWRYARSAGDRALRPIDAEAVGDRTHLVKRLVEKPRPEEAPSLLGTVGRYVLTSGIWPLLEQTPRSPGGEMFLTDTIQMLIDGGGDVFAHEYEGARFDAGRPIGLLKASIFEGLKRPDMADELRDFLSTVGSA
jgi:UTP--glucose-1-phosphate uridylyltransferase